MTIDVEADVVVVGGGPAGSAAVRALARQKLSVIWVTGRPDTSRGAACGPVETLDAGVMALIEARFGIGHEACGAHAHAYAWPADPGLSRDRRGFHVLRPVLDRVLRDAVLRDTQVRVFDGAARTARKNPDRTFLLEVDDATRVSGRFLIDAAGRRHWLARQLGAEVRRVTPPLLLARSVSAAASGSVPMFVGRTFGWLWQANETSDQSTWNLLAAARHPLRRAAIAEASRATTQRIEYIDTTWRLVRPVAAETHALAGEAAAVLDPATGDGIETALRLGHEAARLAMTCLLQPDLAPFAAARYDDMVQRAFRLRAEELADRYRAMGIDLSARTAPARAAPAPLRASAY